MINLIVQKRSIKTVVRNALVLDKGVGYNAHRLFFAQYSLLRCVPPRLIRSFLTLPPLPNQITLALKQQWGAQFFYGDNRRKIIGPRAYPFALIESWKVSFGRILSTLPATKISTAVASVNAMREKLDHLYLLFLPHIWVVNAAFINFSTSRESLFMNRALIYYLIVAIPSKHLYIHPFGIHVNWFSRNRRSAIN